MITKPTIFVLGAGASMPYGFPSGKQLVEHICAATRPNTKTIVDDSQHLISREEIRRTLISTFDETVVEKFGNSLFLSHQLSIDAFLEHRSEFTDVGKLAIALFVLRKEMENHLFDFQYRDKGCYQYLFSKLNANASWDSFIENKIGFITFNYDRSLEHFLFTSLKNTFNKSDQECANHINSIPIIHVHGSLGKLPWQNPNGIPYGTLDDPKKFTFRHDLAVKASKQITVIPEDQTTSNEFQIAFNLLKNAEHIYFLGFSYHPTNIKRLNLENLPKLQTNIGYRLQLSPMKGSAFGMETEEINSVQNKWAVQIRDNTSDSLLFLRKYATLD